MSLAQEALIALRSSKRTLPYNLSPLEEGQVLRVAALIYREQEPFVPTDVVLAIATGIAAGMGGGLTEERICDETIAAADALALAQAA